MRKETFDQWISLEGVETERTYVFPGGDRYRVENPVRLFVKTSGSHKLVDAAGNMHYIKSTWIAFTAKGEFAFNVE